MALPNPPTSPDASKLFAVTYDNGGANAAAAAKSVKQTTVNSEVLGHMAVGTHKDTDTYSSGDAVVLCAGLTGTTVKAFAVNASGHMSINDGGNSITVDGTVGVSGTVTVGTHAVTQSGTWTVNQGGSWTVSQTGTWNVGLSTGTNTVGAVLDGGWDTTGKTVQRGLTQSQTAITEQSLLGADASNLYNITDLVVSWYSGSTAPAAMSKLLFRLGTAGTVFHTINIPPTANLVDSISIQFKEPVRSATNQAITVQLSAALGTSGEYSVLVQAYKTAS